MTGRTFIIKNADELDEVARFVIENLKGYSCIALKGSLGCGKTEWTRHFLRMRGVKNPVVSPTFTYYETYRANGKVYYHFDLYRINSAEEFFLIGGEEILYNLNNTCIVEWPEVIEDILPEKSTMTIDFSVQQDFSRKVVVSDYGS